MARARLSGRRRPRRRRSGTWSRRRRRRSGRIGAAELLLVVLLVVLGLLALRSSRGGGDGDPAPRGGAADDRPAAQLLRTLSVAPEAGGAAYEREAFGEGWLTGPNGCDVRDQVLASESRVPVRRGDDGCAVVAGEWVSLYDGRSTDDPDELEIDHMVPLAEAWDSGAAAWSAERRQRFANDTRRTDALVAVTTDANQSKSDQDPAEWMPPRRDVWCRYADAWITQKAAWELSIDPAERTALNTILRTC